MPVIINEFEVIVDPPQKSNVPAPQPTPQQPLLKPKDIERLVQHFQKRRTRVHAD